MALIEACLTVLRGRDGQPATAPTYQPAIPKLWRSTDAMARIRALLRAHPAGGDLAAFLPELPRDDAERETKARGAVASTLLAGLELARDDDLSLDQGQPYDTVLFRGTAPPTEANAP